MPVVQRVLFPVAVDIATMTLSREPEGWRLAVRSGPAGCALLERQVDVYDRLTLEEAADVLGAILDGFTP